MHFRLCFILGWLAIYLSGALGCRRAWLVLTFTQKLAAVNAFISPVQPDSPGMRHAVCRSTSSCVMVVIPGEHVWSCSVGETLFTQQRLAVMLCVKHMLCS